MEIINLFILRNEKDDDDSPVAISQAIGGEDVGQAIGGEDDAVESDDDDSRVVITEAIGATMAEEDDSLEEGNDDDKCRG